MIAEPREQQIERLLRETLRYLHYRPLVEQIEAALGVTAAEVRAAHGLTTAPQPENLK